MSKFWVYTSNFFSQNCENVLIASYKLIIAGKKVRIMSFYQNCERKSQLLFLKLQVYIKILTSRKKRKKSVFNSQLPENLRILTFSLSHICKVWTCGKKCQNYEMITWNSVAETSFCTIQIVMMGNLMKKISRPKITKENINVKAFHFGENVTLTCDHCASTSEQRFSSWFPDVADAFWCWSDANGRMGIRCRYPNPTPQPRLRAGHTWVQTYAV